MTLKVVLFDLDGTLLNTAEDLGAALNVTLVKNNQPSIAQEKIRKVVSDGALALIKLGFNIDETNPQYQQLRQQLLDTYEKNVSRSTQPFEGIFELLEKLTSRGIQWGVVTNKPSKYAQPVMDAMHFPSPPICIICPDHVQRSKPDPEGLHLACKLSRCTAGEAIYIGDHIRDIESGRNAKMKTVAVGYGYTKDKNEYLNWPADHFVETPADIWPLVKLYL